MFYTLWLIHSKACVLTFLRHASFSQESFEERLYHMIWEGVSMIFIRRPIEGHCEKSSKMVMGRSSFCRSFPIFSQGFVSCFWYLVPLLENMFFRFPFLWLCCQLILLPQCAGCQNPGEAWGYPGITSDFQKMEISSLGGKNSFE